MEIESSVLYVGLSFKFDFLVKLNENGCK